MTTPARNKSSSVPVKTVALAASLGVAGVLAVYFVARLTGTDFTVASPPAVTSPLPWWLFVSYAAGAGAAMFLVIPLAEKFARPRLIAYVTVALGLAAMTPAPFLVSSDFLTIFWLTASHVALVAPLFALSVRLPQRKVE
jgi:hypothetical protein